ncbi:hypothetical protein [Streptomyces sp. NPDC021356]
MCDDDVPEAVRRHAAAQVPVGEPGEHAASCADPPPLHLRAYDGSTAG